MKRNEEDLGTLAGGCWKFESTWRDWKTLGTWENIKRQGAHTQDERRFFTGRVQMESHSDVSPEQLPMAPSMHDSPLAAEEGQTSPPGASGNKSQALAMQTRVDAAMHWTHGVAGLLIQYLEDLGM